MVKASQKEDSSLTMRWLIIICRKNSWHHKGLRMMQFIMVVRSYLIFKLHLLWGKAVCYCTKGTNWNWKKCLRKSSKQQCRFETQNKTWWDPESEKTKDGFRGNKDGIIKETLLADNNQDLSLTVKAAAFCRTLKQKEETRVWIIASHFANREVNSNYCDWTISNVTKMQSSFFPMNEKKGRWNHVNYKE